MTTVIVRVMGASWAAYSIYQYYDGSLFSYHPALLSVGYGAVMTSAILSAKAARSAPPKTKEVHIQWHQISQYVALIFNMGGFVAIFANKIRNDRLHFTSYHSWVGFLALFFACWTLFSGWIANLRPAEVPKYMKDFMENNKGGLQKGLRGMTLFHRAVGALAYIFGVCAALLGLQKYHLGRSTTVLQAGLVVIALVLLSDGFIQGRYNPLLIGNIFKREKNNSNAIPDDTRVI